jgi:hypothetical protein
MGTDILAELRAAGIALSVDGGNLVATPKAALTDELRSLIRDHKAELVAELAAPGELLKPRGPVNPHEVLAAACDGVGIAPEVFRSLLSHEDLDDIAAGDIPVETLRAYAQAFAGGLRSGRIGVPGGEP